MKTNHKEGVREKLKEILFDFWNVYSDTNNAEARDSGIENTLDQIESLITNN